MCDMQRTKMTLRSLSSTDLEDADWCVLQGSTAASHKMMNVVILMRIPDIPVHAMRTAVQRISEV